MMLKALYAARLLFPAARRRVDESELMEAHRAPLQLQALLWFSLKNIKLLLPKFQLIASKSQFELSLLHKNP